MVISSNYQFLRAAAFGELNEMQSLAVRMTDNNLNIEATDSDGSVLEAASERFNHDAVRWQHHNMNALHLSCLMGHEKVIEYLIVQFPVLLRGKCENGETPLLTLTRTIGLVQTVSDQCFDSFLYSGAALDSYDNGNVNALHHLAKLKDTSKLVSYLNIFKSSMEDVASVLTHFLPTELIKMIVAYGNFYSKTVITNTFNQVSDLGCTPLSLANEKTRPLFLEAGAIKDRMIPGIERQPSRKRKCSFQQLRSLFGKKSAILF